MEVKNISSNKKMIMDLYSSIYCMNNDDTKYEEYSEFCSLISDKMDIVRTMLANQIMKTNCKSFKRGNTVICGTYSANHENTFVCFNVKTHKVYVCENESYFIEHGYTEIENSKKYN